MTISVFRPLAVALVLCQAGVAFAATSTKSTTTPSPNERFMRAARESVKESLKDPASAQFSNLRVYKGEKAGDKVVCGRVNARNSYGGYAGFAPFIVRVFYDGKDALGVARIGALDEEARAAENELLDMLSVSGECRSAAARSSKP